LNDALIGTSCNDGLDCTTNDVYDSNCNCVGTFQDSDGDGVCDDNDQCPGKDDAIIGTSCNDDNDCTINDTYDSSCGCSGVYTDADGDGYCIGEDPNDEDGCVPDAGSGACDPCSAIAVDGFESGFGIWNDGGGDCTRVTSFPNTGSYSIRIRDNSGSASSLFSDPIDLSLASQVNISFSFVANSMENGEDFFLEVSTNGGGSYVLYQEWNSGIEFSNNVRYNESVEITGISFTSNTVIRFRCDATANGDQIYLDDIVIDSCEGSSGCTPGTSCDDGDDCTINDEYDANCDCAGTYQDTDNDGICNADDDCEGTVGTIGSACDDDDGCTVGDVLNSNCDCAGQYIDNDGDGYCIGDDPDDNDGCNPDLNSPTCSGGGGCDELTSDDFESGWGNWNDGGGDCTRTTFFPNTGSYSIRIRDNSGSASAMTTDALDMSGYSEVIVDFSFYPQSMENGEDFFLEYSTNNGSTYTIHKSWVKDLDFTNDVREFESVSISGVSFTNQTKIRFRCDASGNGDRIYIDDVVIEGCDTAPLVAEGIQDVTETPDQLKYDLNAYPIPASDKIFLDLSAIQNAGAKVQLVALDGRIVKEIELDENHADLVAINLEAMNEGIYFVRIQNSKIIYRHKSIVISH
jgi:hypothetical protein